MRERGIGAYLGHDPMTQPSTQMKAKSPRADLQSSRNAFTGHLQLMRRAYAPSRVSFRATPFLSSSRRAPNAVIRSAGYARGETGYGGGRRGLTPTADICWVRSGRSTSEEDSVTAPRHPKLNFYSSGETARTLPGFSPDRGLSVSERRRVEALLRCRG